MSTCKYFGAMMKARKEIMRVHEETKQNHGIISCPICGSDLHWSRAQSNGHIHARCSGGDLAWME